MNFGKFVALISLMIILLFASLALSVMIGQFLLEFWEGAFERYILSIFPASAIFILLANIIFNGMDSMWWKWRKAR